MPAGGKAEKRCQPESTLPAARSSALPPSGLPGNVHVDGDTRAKAEAARSSALPPSVSPVTVHVTCDTCANAEAAQSSAKSALIHLLQVFDVSNRPQIRGITPLSP